VGKRGKPKRPRSHQRRAIRDVVSGFENVDRGQLIMACGTGKTLTALWIREALAGQRTLVLLPSLSLLAQTLREWVANATQEFESCLFARTRRSPESTVLCRRRRTSASPSPLIRTRSRRSWVN